MFGISWYCMYTVMFPTDRAIAEREGKLRIRHHYFLDYDDRTNSAPRVLPNCHYFTETKFLDEKMLC